MQTTNLGFIGCGGNARGHMQRAGAVEGVNIAGVCDVVEDIAKERAGEFGAEAYTDHRALLERRDLDAVVISIPVHAHGAPEMDTIERGLPFLVEKPVARDMDTASQIQAAVEEAGILTAVGYQLRYSGAAAQAREFLADKTLGLVVGQYWCGTGIGSAKGWLRQFDKSGGQVLEQATHTIDMMRFLAGEIEEVSAFAASRFLHEIDCPDVNVLALRFANGALGALTTMWAFDPKDWSNANLLSITYDGGWMRWSAAKAIIKPAGEEQEQELGGEGPNIDEVFVRAVRAKNQSLILSPYSDAVKSMAVSIAALESAAENVAKRVGA